MKRSAIKAEFMIYLDSKDLMKSKAQILILIVFFLWDDCIKKISLKFGRFKNSLISFNWWFWIKAAMNWLTINFMLSLLPAKIKVKPTKEPNFSVFMITNEFQSIVFLIY